MANYREYQMIIKLAPSRKTTKNEVSCDLNPYSNLCRSNSNSLFTGTANKVESVHIAKEKCKITRTKTGCLCCRRRKKKCDEKKPGCSGCLRNNLECVYPLETEIKSKTISSRKTKKSTLCYDPYRDTLSSNETRYPEYTPSSPTQPPLLSSPDSANSSDSESPLASPRLQPFSLNLPTNSSDSKMPFLSINTINYNTGLLKDIGSKHTKQISVKSLLN